jgi:hypothetical protein
MIEVGTRMIIILHDAANVHPCHPALTTVCTTVYYRSTGCTVCSEAYSEVYYSASVVYYVLRKSEGC